MRHSRAQFSGLGSLVNAQSLAGFITITCGFEFSVHTGAATVASDRQVIVFARERGGNRRPGQRDLPGRKSRIELLNGRQRIRRWIMSLR